MPILTGYTQTGNQGVFDLASVGQRQQQIDMQKRAAQEEQWSKAFEAVKEAYEKKKKEKKMDEMMKELGMKAEKGKLDEKYVLNPQTGEYQVTYETPQDFSFMGGMFPGGTPMYPGYGGGQGSYGTQEGQNYIDIYGLE